MRRLAAGILGRPLGGITVCLCLAALGLLAAAGLNVNLVPATRFPVLTITTRLPDAAPSEVETLITRPLEEAMRGVVGLRRIYSRSFLSTSEVTLELHTAADVSAAAAQARGRLRGLRKDLPRDARPPVISLYSPSDRPAALLGVTGGGSLAAAGDWAREELLPALRRVDGVAQVELSGAPEPEVRVVCDPLKLGALGLTAAGVGQALNRGSSSLPGGELSPWSRHRPLRTAGAVDRVAQIAAIPVAVKGDKVVTVGEVAQVIPGHRDPDQVTRLGGKPVASVSIFAAAGADPSRLWGRLETALARIEAPDRPAVEVIFSQAQSLRRSLERLGWIALMAAGAAALVLLLFLRSLSATAVVLAALPFSLLTAMLLLRLFGVRMDLLALSGLALALGVLVDNAVVVIESVFARWQEGEDAVEGAAAGVAEVATPIAFATLTTMAAFLPLVLVSDRVRLQLGGFFWGMSLSLAASLMAALVLAPLLMVAARRWLGLTPPRAVRPGRGERASRLLGWTTRRPGRVILLGLVFLGLAGLAAPQVGFRSEAGLGSRGWNVIVVLPPGTAQSTTGDFTRQVEDLALGIEGVERVHGRVWGNQGRVTVTLDEADQGRAPEVKARLEKGFPQGTKAQFHLLPLSSGAEETLTLNLYGPELSGLFNYQKDIRARLDEVTGIKDVILRMGSPAPELRLELDHRLLGVYGLDAARVAEEVRAHLTGPVAVRIPQGERELEVRVLAADRPIPDAAILRQIYIPVADHRQVPLTELVRTRVAPAPSELFRQDLRRVVRMTLVLDGIGPLEAARALEEALAGLSSPEGYTWSLGEEVERITTTRREMLTGVVLALMLVYLVMVAASESLLGPLVVMAAAPFAAAGAVLGLWAAGLTVDMPVYLGLVILAGLLVNTGIVMIDAMAGFRDRGHSPPEAARLGALRRLRPVLMTTLSTTAAAAPLFLDTGAGSGAWGPLALTLASGLVCAAGASLFLTPALYPLAVRLEERLGLARPLMPAAPASLGVDEP